MSHPFVLLAQQRAADPPARVDGIEGAAQEALGLAVMATPLIAAIGVYAYGRSQKRSNLASGVAGVVAGTGTFLGLASAFMGARPGESLATGAAVVVPSIGVPLILLTK